MEMHNVGLKAKWVAMRYGSRLALVFLWIDACFETKSELFLDSYQVVFLIPFVALLKEKMSVQTLD